MQHTLSVHLKVPSQTILLLILHRAHSMLFTLNVLNILYKLCCSGPIYFIWIQLNWPDYSEVPLCWGHMIGCTDEYRRRCGRLKTLLQSEVAYRSVSVITGDPAELYPAVTHFQHWQHRCTRNACVYTTALEMSSNMAVFPLPLPLV